ncbi:arylsulfatase [Planctomycetes bacterium TBK1r]|uniref:Arylsulfatase n=1 Tax=Stieleria magnilauensis TaxID=2527963 RepID=A0ABX5XV90_9BACT|nr:Arylsulfatase [Planctomycetes bacterium TBK1r]
MRSKYQKNTVWFVDDLKSMGLLGTCLFLFCLFAETTIGAARPNIILVMADDLGWSDIGCFGGEIRTPRIDSLAREGLRFTQFYNNAVCGPTRASLLTGLYCQQTGHRGDHWNQPKDYSKCVLISELLQNAGYHTMMVGKWQGRDLALDRGFDRFFGPMCQAKISYFHEVQQNPYYLDRERFQLPEDFYLTESLNHYAVQFLKEAVTTDKPFFLYVAHIAPHWPLHARESDVAAYREQYRDHGWDECRSTRFESQQKSQLIPSHWKLAPRSPDVKDWKDDANHDWQAERMAVYAAQVSAIDEGLGELLDVVQESGQEENTLVLFLSDNGAAPDGGLRPSKSGFGFSPQQPNDSWRLDQVAIRPGSGPDNLPGPPDTFAAYGLAWATLSNTPFRSTKLSGYEGGIRTPLLARWPAVISGDQKSDDAGHVMDLMATCLDIADVNYPSEFHGRIPVPIEGKSLRPVFEGKPREGHDVLCWSVPRHHVVRMGKWKAIRPRQGGAWQLFDLEADGTETTDLAQREPDRVKQLARQFEIWRQRVKDQ